MLLNSLQIALLRWYDVNQSGIAYNAQPGSAPGAICFDGANIWVASLYSGTVSKL